MLSVDRFSNDHLLHNQPSFFLDILGEKDCRFPVKGGSSVYMLKSILPPQTDHEYTRGKDISCGTMSSSLNIYDTQGGDKTFYLKAYLLVEPLHEFVHEPPDVISQVLRLFVVAAFT